MQKTEPKTKQLPADTFDPVEDVVNAALVGSASMGTMEPFGAVIGAAVAVAEEEGSRLAKPDTKPTPSLTPKKG